MEDFPDVHGGDYMRCIIAFLMQGGVTRTRTRGDDEQEHVNGHAVR